MERSGACVADQSPGFFKKGDNMNYNEMAIKYEDDSLIRYDRGIERKDQQERQEEIREYAIELLYEAIEFIRGNSTKPLTSDADVQRKIQDALSDVL